MSKLKWLLLLFLAAGVVYGAGSITETLLRPPSTVGKWDMNKITLDWTCDASGDVSGTDTTVPLDGEIYRVVFIPDSNASGSQPSADYDVTLLDDDGADVLLGRGADRSNTATEQIIPILDDGQSTAQYFGRVAVHGMLELQVANAGTIIGGTTNRGGKVIIYWK